MTRIPEKATQAAQLAWKNGRTVVLWVDTNDNTREVRVYQSGWRVTRHTGRNIRKLMAEIDDAQAKGELTWAWANAGALSFIRSWVEHLEERKNRKCISCGEICTTTDCETTWQQEQCYCCGCWNDRIAKFEGRLK